MKARDIIFEDYRTAAQRFVQQGASRKEVDELIKQFRDLLDRKQIKDANRKQIDWWAKQGWESFSSFVRGYEGHITPTQSRRRKVVGNSIPVKETDDWLVVIPLDKEASCFHGKHTSWCTAMPHESHWEDYFYDTKAIMIYVIGKKKQGSYAIAGGKDDGPDDLRLFDERDQRITPEQMRLRTGIDPIQLWKDVLEMHGKRIRGAQVSPFDLISNWLKDASNKQRNPEVERALIKAHDPELAMRYLHQTIETKKGQTFPDSLVELAFLMFEPSDVPDDANEETWEDPRENMQAHTTRLVPVVLAGLDHVPMRVENLISRYASHLAVHMRQPSKALIKQAAIARQDVFSIFLERGLLDNSVILDAITKYPNRLKLFANQTEEMQLAAIRNKHGNILRAALDYLKDPTERVQMAAVAQDPVYAFISLANPSKRVIIAALSQDPSLIARVNPEMIDNDVLKTAFDKSWVSSQYLPKDRDGRIVVKIPPPAQKSLAKSFWRAYRNHGTEPAKRGHRTSMLQYHLPEVERLITDPGAQRFMRLLRDRFEVDSKPSNGTL